MHLGICFVFVGCVCVCVCVCVRERESEKPEGGGWNAVIYCRIKIWINNIFCTWIYTHWSSVTVVYPLKGLMPSVFRHALLQTTVVMHGYTASFNRSGPSPLISLINNAFLIVFPQSCCSLDVFSLSHHSLQTLETVVCEDHRSAVSEILWHQQSFHSQSHLRSHFFPIWSEKTAEPLDHVCMLLCIYLLPHDWLMYIKLVYRCT